jgi:thiol-disulfide isomerase/thioredoxin
MQAKAVKYMNSTPPRFFTPHPAEFNFTAVGKGVEPLDFKAYRGRVVVLNVWATWCQPGELSSFARLAAHYSDDEDVAVVCVSQEPTNTVFKNKGAMSSGAPLYCVSGQRLPGVYKTNGIPATFVIDKNGMIVFEQVGYFDWSHPSVIKLIDSLRKRSNTAPEPSVTAP